MDTKLDIDTPGTQGSDMPALDLEARDGWPSELLFLAERFPRENWEAHPNLGALTKFWLQRHNMFRELGRALQSATIDFRGGVTPVEEFTEWFTPRLQFFLNQLQLHHAIEDQHYFPLFVEGEPRLKAGFEALAGDHAKLADMLLATAEAANAFLAVLDDTPVEHREVAQRYGAASDALLDIVLRHMDDEECLVVPLTLDRGEAELGITDTFEVELEEE